MSPTTVASPEEILRRRATSNTSSSVTAVDGERPGSGVAVSWPAIFAGAAAAAALSLILLVLGVGLGLSAVSPWTQAGIAATTFGMSTILWITLTQVVASGMGGYLAGRLRAQWLSVHGDEAYFRDTAHGFLAWAVASLVTAAVLTSAIGSIVGGTVQAGAAVAGGVTSATAGAAATMGVQAKVGDSSGPMDYLMDRMFRRDAAASPSSAVGAESSNGASSHGASSAEVSRILLTSMTAGALPVDDLRYAAQVVSQRTGLTQAEAEKRVNETFARAQTQWRDAQTAAKQAADTARKTSAYGALWLFVSLLTGAFVASFAATVGGRQRDM
jgi:hypothetical protein